MHSVKEPLSPPPRPAQSLHARFPGQDFHQMALALRHARRREKVQAICRCELEGIFALALCLLPLARGSSDYCEMRASRRLRYRFRHGLLSPNPALPPEKAPELLTPLRPLHSVEVAHFLHFESRSFYDDVSAIFGLGVTEARLVDPNGAHSRFLQALQRDVQPFLNAYAPYARISFPFIVAVAGPPGGGKTTICQYLMRAFDAHVIECMPFARDAKAPQRAGRPTDGGPPPNSWLRDAIPVYYHDEKNCVAQIVEIVRARVAAGKGFIIAGYPTNKAQFVALEKGLSAAGANTLALQTFLPPMRARVRAQLRSINGLILAMCTEPHPSKLVDPHTNCVYQPGFCMPGIADLVGATPALFAEAVVEIRDRLEEVTDLPAAPLAPRFTAQYAQIEQQLKRSIPTIVVSNSPDIFTVLQTLDTFVCQLYSKNPEDLLNQTPLATLARPTSLVRPVHCFLGLSAWRRCLELFGQTLAEQSNFISTLTDRLDVLVSDATDRYRLLISHKDSRLQLCRDFLSSPAAGDPSAHFHRIWDASIAVRNANIAAVDEVIDKSGLVELVMELQRSAKKVFIALVQRLRYVQWYTDEFAYLAADDFGSRPFPFFETLDVGSEVEPPRVLYRSTEPCPQVAPPASETPSGFAVRPPRMSISRPFRRALPVTPPPPITSPVPGLAFLLEKMALGRDRPSNPIYFDAQRACAELGIPPFFAYGVTFAEIASYAPAFFAHFGQSLTNPVLVEEAGIAHALFARFTAMCARQEAAMVKAVLDLKDALVKSAYAKCTREMERFSTRFRAWKKGEAITGEMFEYDGQGPLELRMQEMGSGEFVQRIVPMEALLRVAMRLARRGIEYSTEEEFMGIAKEVVKGDELVRLQICLRILECVQCFSVEKFCGAFARSMEDEERLKKVLNARKVRANAPTSARARRMSFMISV
jgi:adenylate kinase family enzyme